MKLKQKERVLKVSSKVKIHNNVTLQKYLYIIVGLGQYCCYSLQKKIIQTAVLITGKITAEL